MQIQGIKKYIALYRKPIIYYVLALFISFLIVFISSIVFANNENSEMVMAPSVPTATVTLTPTPEIIPFTTYEKPTIERSELYNVFLVGDSMTHAFGPRGGQFNEILSSTEEYEYAFFEVSNYAQANQSILQLPNRLNEPVEAAHDLTLGPIIEGEPDLIIIESFGYNPLSQFGEEGGLERQEEVLDEVMTRLTNRFPNTAILFLAAIAPDKMIYGLGVNQANTNERIAQAEERMRYIENHIEYAREHNIPVANAYEQSLDTEGDGNSTYINPDDNIHPSAEGLALMGRIMTRRIIEENIFPSM